jgi:hypothetical protein
MKSSFQLYDQFGNKMPYFRDKEHRAKDEPNRQFANRMFWKSIMGL